MDLLSTLSHFEILLAMFLVLIAIALGVNGILLHKHSVAEQRAWNHGFDAMQRRERSAAGLDMTLPAALEISMTGGDMTIPAGLYATHKRGR
jgi:hypothetical protein